MYMAIQKSSNIYMAYLIDRIINRLSVQWYCDKMHEIFGFGKKTGIEYPYENAGFFPKPGANYANGTSQWSGPTPYSLVMGYNFMATSMQMIRAFGIIANGGMDVRPTFLKKIEPYEQASEGKKRATPRRVISESVCQEIVSALRYATKPGGCAHRADVPGFTEAAKTGTAEKIQNGKYNTKNHLSSAIGFAPAKNPKFVLSVAIDEPKYQYVPGIGRLHFGGVCAAPVFREMATRALNYLGESPDDPHGYPTCDPRADPAKAVWAQESENLAKLYKLWNQ
jgi:cell division protein FtsI (penicillin-binding protein 3)